VLVNSIGGFLLGEAGNATPEDLRVMVDVSPGAALWLSQAVEPYMRQRGSGAIVHVPARPGTDPSAGMTAYSLSKAALSHLVRILDLELRPHGIRVTAVAPQLRSVFSRRVRCASGAVASAAMAGRWPSSGPSMAVVLPRLQVVRPRFAAGAPPGPAACQAEESLGSAEGG